MKNVVSYVHWVSTCPYSRRLGAVMVLFWFTAGIVFACLCLLPLNHWHTYKSAGIHTCEWYWTPSTFEPSENITSHNLLLDKWNTTPRRDSLSIVSRHSAFSPFLCIFDVVLLYCYLAITYYREIDTKLRMFRNTPLFRNSRTYPMTCMWCSAILITFIKIANLSPSLARWVPSNKNWCYPPGSPSWIL